MKPPPNSRARRPVRLAVAGLAALLLAGGALAQDPAPAPPPEPKAELKPLSVPLPIGRTAKTLRIPQYNLSGAIMSQLLAGEVTRLDDEFLGLRELKLDFYDEAGRSDFQLDLPASRFSVKTRMLTSEEEVYIRHRDFDLTGARMEFNTATRKGRLFGPVRMILRNVEDLTAPKPSPSPDPAAPAAVAEPSPTPR